MLQLYWGFLGGLIWNSSRLFGNRLLCKKTSSQWKKNCGARVFGVEDESWYHGISSKMFVGPNGIPQETGILGWSSLPRCQPSLPMTRKITYLASTAKNMIALETCRFEYFMSFPLRWQGFRAMINFSKWRFANGTLQSADTRDTCRIPPLHVRHGSNRELREKTAGDIIKFPILEGIKQCKWIYGRFWGFHFPLFLWAVFWGWCPVMTPMFLSFVVCDVASRKERTGWGQKDTWQLWRPWN